jgi:hypothetical protein
MAFWFGGVLVDVGYEFGGGFDVFWVLVGVLLGEHFFFVCYSVVEEGYSEEGYEGSQEGLGVYGGGEGAEACARVNYTRL